MSSKNLRHTKIALRTAVWTLGVLSIVVATVSIVQSDAVQARLMRQQEITPWFALEGNEVSSGATIPKNTHTVFHLPFNFTSIDREVLLGQKGEQVRYWGYCFPENYDPKLVSNRSGFPGQMFLSERERAVREAQAKATAPVFSLLNLPDKLQVERLQQRQVGSVRHQIETFKAGMICYIMSEEPLAIGLDTDGDGLNNKLEVETGTDPSNPDTDADGIVDGKEYFYGTSAVLRDTDGDGIIDGIEDENWNGYLDTDETDPRNRDTDRDDMCDGMCRIRLSNGQQIYAGEDKNLNGSVDLGETNPLKMDSRGDGYGDYQRFLKCLLERNSNC